MGKPMVAGWTVVQSRLAMGGWQVIHTRAAARVLAVLGWIRAETRMVVPMEQSRRVPVAD